MKSLLIAAALILSTGFVQAENSVNLEWDANPASEEVIGYRVYQKVTSTAIPPVVTWLPVGQTTTTKFTVLRVPLGTTTYAVAAYNKYAEGNRSNEVAAALIPPSPPTKLRIITVTVTP